MNLSVLLGKTTLGLKNNAPLLGTIAGAAGMTLGIVELCKAVRKIDDVKAEVAEELAHADELDKWMTESMENPEMLQKIEEKLGQSLTPEYANKVKVGAKINSYAKWVKLFAPSVTIIGMSMGCLIGSNLILSKRVKTLGIAYTGLLEAYNLYRSRVVDKYGKEEDKNLLYGIKEEEILKTVTDEKGKTKKVRETVKVSDGKLGSPYARFADESANFVDDLPEYNDAWLKTIEAAANSKLKTYGYIFLNDVYKMLDMPQTPNGVNVGWVLAGEYGVPVEGHDNHISFDLTHARNARHNSGLEENIIIDFNVDGVITEIFPKYKKAA